MRKGIAITVIIVLSAVFGGLAQASGYSIYEQGAKASAQAGAFTARADDPSAIFYNPAGITQLKGRQLYVSGNFISVGDSTFSSATTNSSARQDKDLVFPFSVYYTHNIEDSPVSWGVGIFTPFGLKTEWGPDFEGRYLARKSELKTLYINPTLAIEAGGGWSFAIGADYVFADVELTRNLDFSAFAAPDGLAELEGDGDGYGANAAVRFETEDGLSWGLSWRGKVNVDIDDGDARFSDTAAAADLAFCSGDPCFPNQKAIARITLPDVIATGFAVERGRLDFEFDLVWHKWSLFRKLGVDFQENTALLSDEERIQNWDDSLSHRLGIGLDLTKNYEARFGLYYDENPIPDSSLRPLLPDSNRTSVQAGLGYKSDSEKFNLDVYYQFIKFSDALTQTEASGLNGEYKTQTIIGGAAATWIF